MPTSGLRTELAPVPTAQPAKAVQPPASSGTTGLRAPAELAAGKALSATDAERFRSGAAFASVLTNSRVTVNGTHLGFAPQWDAAGARDSGKAALALFEFQLNGMTGAQELTFAWADEPKAFSNLFIGIGNFETNRWDWFQGTAAPLELADIAPYQAADGRAFVAVMLLGMQSAELRWGKFGGNILPTATLTSPAPTGTAPYNAPVDASGSSDPDGSIATYDYDFDNNGTYEVLNGGPQRNIPYALPGTRTCAVRVTDNTGGQATATLEIQVLAPSGPPVASLTADYVFLDGSGTARLSAAATAAPNGVTSYEWDLNNDGTFELNTGMVPTQDFSLPGTGDFMVSMKVTDTISQTDTASLTIHGDGDGYDEVENNDDFAAGNLLPGLGLQGFEGNLGDTGTNDGDLEDWYKLEIDGPQSVQLNLLFADADADLDLRLLDTDGTTQLGSSSGTADNERITYSFAGAGTYYVRCFRYGTVASDADYTLDFKVLSPPQVELQADTTSGNSPLTVNFTAAAADSDGTVDNYEWDFNGDGTYELDTNTAATTTHTYVSGGTFSAAVRVTDNDNATAIDQLPITVVVDYDEVENNDAYTAAQTLPAWDFSGFYGNIGAGGPLDGDSSDWYKFTTGAGNQLALILAFDSAATDLDLALYEADGTTVVLTSAGTDDDEFVMLTTSSGTYYLNVYYKAATTKLDACDYALSMYAVSINEVEPNETPGGGNVLPTLPFTKFGGALELHVASEDPFDWYKLNIAAPGAHTLWLRMIDDVCDADFRLFDTDGTTQLGSSTGTDNEERIVYTFASAGTYYLKVYNYALGPGSYLLQGQ